MMTATTITTMTAQLTWRGGAAVLFAAEEMRAARCFSPAAVMVLPARLRWVSPVRSAITVTNPSSPPSPSWLSVREGTQATKLQPSKIKWSHRKPSRDQHVWRIITCIHVAVNSQNLSSSRVKHACCLKIYLQSNFPNSITVFTLTFSCTVCSTQWPPPPSPFFCCCLFTNNLVEMTKVTSCWSTNSQKRRNNMLSGQIRVSEKLLKE